MVSWGLGLFAGVRAGGVTLEIPLYTVFLYRALTFENVISGVLDLLICAARPLPHRHGLASGAHPHQSAQGAEAERERCSDASQRRVAESSTVPAILLN